MRIDPVVQFLQTADRLAERLVLWDYASVLRDSAGHRISNLRAMVWVHTRR